MTAPTPDSTEARTRLTGARLRWCCDAEWLGFETTAEIEPITGLVGQDEAVEALRFGLEFDAPGQNVYVRGLTGSGRMTIVRQLLEELRPSCGHKNDRCYVHNFRQPDRPRLVSLEPGQGRAFQRALEGFVDFVESQLTGQLDSDALKARRTALEDRVQREIRELGKPFEDDLRRDNLALVPVQVGQVMQPTILPVIDGQPVSYQAIEKLRAEGRLSEADVEDMQRKITAHARRLEDVNRKVLEVQSTHAREMRDLVESEARRVLEGQLRPVREAFPGPAVKTFLDDVVDDVLRHRLVPPGQEPASTRRYRVNVLVANDADDGCPIVIENAPTLPNLLGNVDREFGPGGAYRSDHLMVQAGSLLRADGGYLILDAREVLSEPGAWKVLTRTLRTGKVDIVPAEMAGPWPVPVLNPEPVDVDVKVVLIGEGDIHALLDATDPDFPHLFKVLSDFDTTVERSPEATRHYAGVLARIAADEGLGQYSRSAVVALVEHAARIAGRQDRLTTRFGRLADIAREAAYVARKRTHGQGGEPVTDEDVLEAVRRGRRRADLPARRFRKLVSEGTIRIQTDGEVVGQVNGLAVVHAGPLTYGFPARITATVGPGTAGAINIEREANLSGAIHTKGFYILGGLLRRLLRTEHPLAFSASVAFEQSYGGIDGDSASGAEMCCLLSALTDVPLRQGLAMTGAIDQLGNIQPIGAVTEKVEGFFAACSDAGLTGEQGVIIPQANARDLMLERTVLNACDAGRFHVYAVSTIAEALALYTGWSVGELDGEGEYAEGTLLRLARSRARDYWRMVAGTLAAQGPPEDAATAPDENEPGTDEESGDTG